jgi:hypothetical protein
MHHTSQQVWEGVLQKVGRPFPYQENMIDIIVTIAPGILVFEAVTDRAKLWMRTSYTETLVQFDAIEGKEQAKRLWHGALGAGLKVEQAAVFDKADGVTTH